MKYYLAIDIGASSGRHILGWTENGKIKIDEIHRFANEPKKKEGHLFWNTEVLFKEILAGLRKCRELNKIPESIGIDTWGVDYALLDKDNKLIDDVYCYRDSRTESVISVVHKSFSQSILYNKTGIQFQPFNTIYQLTEDVISKRISKAESFLMLPDYFNFLLTSVKVNEYTNATTTGLINVLSKEWDKEIINELEIPSHLFGDLRNPGTIVGYFTKEVQEIVGFNARVILPATHDTASAVIAVPCQDNALYISSGTWSLMGVELETAKVDTESQKLNYTNEGGYEYKYRYLKNIMGLWIIQCVRHELNDCFSFDEIVELARQSKNFKSKIGVNDKRFLNPPSMIKEINAYLLETGQDLPITNSELFYCIYKSLAISYAEMAEEIENLTNKKYDIIYIVGGGSKNEYLSQLTVKTTKKKIISGPIEATAIGNLSVQMISAGEIKDKKVARKMIKESFDIKQLEGDY